jgi:2'-5' RNA ligase
MKHPDAPSKRIFFALPAALKAVDKLAEFQEIMQQNSRGLKIVPVENYHITLKFLGQVDEKVWKSIIADFSSVSLATKPVPYKLKGTGAFPGLKRPSVLWLGIDVDVKCISEIQAVIENLSHQYGFAPEKRGFTPHLTVARIKWKDPLQENIRDYFSRNAETFYAESEFDRVVLFESALTTKGPVYTALTTRMLQQVN